MVEVIERGLEVSKRQAVFLAKEVENQEGRLPRTYEGGELKTSDYRAWISGFFPGVLWYLYENTPTDELKKICGTIYRTGGVCQGYDHHP